MLQWNNKQKYPVIKRMINLNRLFILSVISVIFSLPCNAADNRDVNSVLVNNLVKKYLSAKETIDVKNTWTLYQGDFNADGVNDFALVFLPATKITESNKLRVVKLWSYPTSVTSGVFHKSIAIFHGSKNGWLSDDVQVFVLLDKTGVLETPSFKLLISHVGDKEYKNHISYLPIKLKSDLIIVPTEAGIDTYIYWDKNAYKLFEPEEIP